MSAPSVRLWRIEHPNGLGLMRGPRSEELDWYFEVFDSWLQDFFPSWQCEFWALSGEELGYGLSSIKKAPCANGDLSGLRSGVLDRSILEDWIFELPDLPCHLGAAGYEFACYEAPSDQVLLSSSERPKQAIFVKASAEFVTAEPF